MMPDVFVIWSVEHGAWWAPDHDGYTRVLEEAGRYTEAESARILANANVVRIEEYRIALSVIESAIREPID